MTLFKEFIVHNPYWDLWQEMVHGPSFIVHLVIKVGKPKLGTASPDRS